MRLRRQATAKSPALRNYIATRGSLPLPVQMKLVIFTQFFKRRRGRNFPQALAAQQRLNANAAGFGWRNGG